jgi:hypothetical protein
MTDFRALCAELIDGIDEFATVCDTGEPFYQLITRVRAALGEPEPEGPTDDDLRAQIMLWLGCTDLPSDDQEWPEPLRIPEILGLLRAVLARWGRPAAPAVEPIPVSERLPEDDDCLVIPPLGASTFPLRYCWQAREIMHCGQARLIWDWKLVPHTTEEQWPFTYWLPATTRFLPTTVDPAQPT